VYDLLLKAYYSSDEECIPFAKEAIITDPNMVKFFRNGPVETYDIFGTYITSLTPSVFTAKANIMVYQDNWDLESDLTHMISYVKGSDTSDDIFVYAPNFWEKHPSCAVLGCCSIKKSFYNL